MVKYSPSCAVVLESSDANSGTERKVAASMVIRPSMECGLYTAARHYGSHAFWQLWWEAARLYNFGGEIASQAQPARKHNPPIGVIAPNQSRPCGISAIVYKLPLKSRMPAKSSHQAPRFADPKSASIKSAIE